MAPQGRKQAQLRRVCGRVQLKKAHIFLIYTQILRQLGYSLIRFNLSMVFLHCLENYCDYPHLHQLLLLLKEHLKD